MEPMSPKGQFSTRFHPEGPVSRQSEQEAVLMQSREIIREVMRDTNRQLFYSVFRPSLDDPSSLI
jgi:hypothetical protein